MRKPAARTVSDLIFGVQIIATFIFGWSQFQRVMIHHGSAHISWYASWEAFFFVGLLLALRAYQNVPCWEHMKVVLAYALWNIAMGINLMVLLTKGGRWDGSDWVITGGMIVAAIVIVLWTRSRGLQAIDPAVKGLLAVAWKGFPQLVMAYCVAFVPANHGDITAASAWAGSATMVLRFAQIRKTLLLSKTRDRNLVWAFWGETSNCLSWLAVVIARFVL